MHNICLSKGKVLWSHSHPQDSPASCCTSKGSPYLCSHPLLLGGQFSLLLPGWIWIVSFQHNSGEHSLCLDILSLWFCLFFKKKPCHTHLVTSRYAESNALKHIFRPNLFNPEFCLRDITLPLITVGSEKSFELCSPWS